MGSQSWGVAAAAAAVQLIVQVMITYRWAIVRDKHQLGCKMVRLQSKSQYARSAAALGQVERGISCQP